MTTDSATELAGATQAQRIDAIAAEAMALFGSGRQVAPFSSRPGGFGMADAYAVAERLRDLRQQRGETPVGRKIGFTNTNIWATYGVAGPIWNYMFDSTVRACETGETSVALAGLAQPLIEPEIALHLARAPHRDMNDAELIGCIDWIAHGYEIVHSIFPNWTFTAADAVAAYGMHGAYLIGMQHAITPDTARWVEQLATFAITLTRGDGLSRSGRADNVLGGPLQALRFLIDELARDPAGAPLAAGEIITTGTLTDAMPIAPGETWTTRLDGLDVEGLRLRLA